MVSLMTSFVSFADSQIEMSETTYDFGTIREDGGAVRHEFRFTNTGDTPLVIVDAKAECGCTRPEYPLKPIEPGKSGVIRVTYLPQGRPGEFVKSVKVTTNAPKQKKVKIKISGTVIPSAK